MKRLAALLTLLVLLLSGSGAHAAGFAAYMDVLKIPGGVDALTVAALQKHEVVCTDKTRTASFKAARAKYITIFKTPDDALLEQAHKALDEALEGGRGELCRQWTKLIDGYERAMRELDAE